jgi:hypothetical protein
MDPVAARVNLTEHHVDDPPPFLCRHLVPIVDERGEHRPLPNQDRLRALCAEVDLLLVPFWMFSARHLRIKVESLSAPALAASLTAQVPNYWQRATRGLGQAEIVDGGYDVQLFAVGGGGNLQSQERRGSWSMDSRVVRL